MFDLRPPEGLRLPLKYNYNTQLIFTIPSGFTYSENDNYVPSANVTETYNAICHNSSKPQEDSFYATDVKGEWIRGRLTEPLIFSSNISHLIEVRVNFVKSGLSYNGTLYLPTQNPYSQNMLGQKFDILLNLNP